MRRTDVLVADMARDLDRWRDRLLVLCPVLFGLSQCLHVFSDGIVMYLVIAERLGAGVATNLGCQFPLNFGVSNHMSVSEHCSFLGHSREQDVKWDKLKVFRVDVAKVFS
jgi:hypothetical protein